MNLSKGSAKKQKWMMKRTRKNNYQFYDYRTEMHCDRFLDSVSREEKASWYPDLLQQRKKAEECMEGEGAWYFVFSGPTCGLYTNYKSFIEARDSEFQQGGASKKATLFRSLEEAKSWVQGSRDEEGAHWGWPNPMPIYF